MRLEVRQPEQPGWLKQLLGHYLLFWRWEEKRPRYWLIGVNGSGAVVLKLACDHEDEAWEKHDRIAGELTSMSRADFGTRYDIDISDLT